jgi:pectin methylesterase-like acyl-CoA thioesterase
MKYLKQIISLVFLAVVSTMEAQIVVEAGNAESLLEAIDKANKQNIDSTASRLFVFIPNGVYDLGDRTLTQIWGHNIALVGESMEGVIIKNAPAVENEGISKTATLLNRGWNTYVQDLTLQNALDYYRSGPAGRAVCWQDKGNYTIFKRVRMLSYQDTYYSHSEECSHYFEDSEVHGTVDFLCGAGDVYFNHCLIVTEKRNEDGSGKDVIAAPRTSTTKFGYVFNHCTIRNDMSVFAFARGWHTNPRCVWLNTTLESPEKLMTTRFDPYGIRSVDNAFFEYNTMDVLGHNITPESNVVEFVVNDQCRRAETVMSEKEAAKYTVKNVFPKWRPDKKTRKLEKQCARMKKQYLKTNL